MTFCLRCALQRFDSSTRENPIMSSRRKFLSSVLFSSASLALVACGVNPAASSQNPAPAPAPEPPVLLVSGETIPIPGVGPSTHWLVGIDAGGVGMGSVIFKSFGGRAYLVRRITYTLLNAGQSAVPPKLRNFSLMQKGMPLTAIISSLDGNKLVFDFIDPLLIPGDGSTVAIELGGEVFDGLGADFQFGVEAASDILATDTDGTSIVPVNQAGFPLALLNSTVSRGGIKARLAANSPTGAVNLLPDTQKQIILVADLEALGEDVLVNDMVVAFRLFGIRAADLANLLIRDEAGTLLGSTVAMIPNIDAGARLSVVGLGYLIPKGETQRFYVYLDTKPGAAGMIQSPFLGDIRSEGVTSGNFIGSYSVIGNTLTVA